MSRRHFPDNKIWANNPSEITDPTSALWANAYESGEGKAPPEAGVHNYIFNRSDEQHQHIEQNGIPRWLTDTEYADGGLALGSDGVIYQSQGAANQGNDPTTDDGTNWLPLPSVNLFYDNSGSTLTSDNPQGAIDELDGKIENLDGTDIDYDNSSSGLSATNSQDAIDEVNNKVEGVASSGVEVFTADGTWNIPSNVASFDVIVVGGGGQAEDDSTSGTNGQDSSFSYNSVVVVGGGAAGSVGGSASGGDLGVNGGDAFGERGGISGLAYGLPGKDYGGGSNYSGSGSNPSGGGGGGTSFKRMSVVDGAGSATVTVGSGGSSFPSQGSGDGVVIIKY